MAPPVEVAPGPRFDPAEEFPRPPAEAFWDKYSKRLECPTAWVGAVLLWVLLAVGYSLAWDHLFKIEGGELPVRFLEVDGVGASDGGAPGSGGDPNPTLVSSEQAFAAAPEVVDPLPTLPDAGEPIQTPPREVDAKPVGPGSKPGVGAGDAVGPDKGRATGDGVGTRGFGWTLKFKFEDAREFSKQLAAAGAVIFVPEGEVSSKKGMLYADLTNPQVGRAADKGDPIFSGRLGLYEQDPKKIKKMLEYLGAPEAKTYGVFFPKKFMEELADKELAYRNRRPEDIALTVFAYSMRGDRYEVTVVEQKVKK